MSTRKEFTTKSGLTLPLTNLKGKEYLLAAHRIQWFVHENSNYTMDTKFLELTSDRAVTMTTIKVFNENGMLIKSVDGIKAEDKKDFPDFIEKAVTGSQARALLFLGYGTQFSGDELNELVNAKGETVNRLVDSPLEPKSEETQTIKSGNKISSFSKKKVETAPAPAPTASDGWE